MISAKNKAGRGTPRKAVRTGTLDGQPGNTWKRESSERCTSLEEKISEAEKRVNAKVILGQKESWQNQRIVRRPVWLKGIKLKERINGGCHCGCYVKKSSGG